MANEHQIGLNILRVMVDEVKLKPNGRIQEAQLMERTGFETTELRRAAEYMNGIGGYIFGPNTTSEYVLTNDGLNYLEAQRKQYRWLPLDAERILRWLASNDGEASSQEMIAALRFFDPSRFYRAAEYLEQRTYIKDLTAQSAIYKITEKGYDAVQDDFLRSTGSTTQIGAVIGQMSGGAVQAVAAAYNSQVHQIVDQTNPQALRDGIIEVVEQLAKTAGEQLSVQQQAEYMQAAAQFQAEVRKENPDRTTLERLIKVLSFGDSLNGALDLGTKTLPLMAAAAPYIAPLAQAVEQLFR